MDIKNNRRQFLRNTSLAAIGLSLKTPILANTNSNKIKKGNTILCDKTTLDYYGEGPFYTENPPLMADNKLADINEPGTAIIISGQVRTLDCSAIIPNTLIDVWHADDAGDYDNASFNLRGHTFSNAQGFYMFQTILPGKYLNGANFRPAHIHFRITPPGFDILTTQLYFEGDTHIPTDAAASINSGEFDATERIISLSENAQGIMEGTWDIIVDGDGVSSVNDIHINKGVIYKISPNPFRDNLNIRYGVFNKSKVELFVYDMSGHQVATLEEKTLVPGQYDAIWAPDSKLANGHYFIILTINGLQINYLKVLKQ